MGIKTKTHLRQGFLICLWLAIDFLISMISKDKKKQIIKELVDKFSRQKAIVFFDYSGLKVNQFQELRKKLREQGIDCQAVKKTLVDLALEKAGLKTEKIKQMPGQMALVLGYEDEIIPARVLYQFAKDNESVKIVAGLIQGDYLEKQAIIDLAQLPSKQELLAQLVGGISAPLRGLNYVLQANLIKLIYILKSLKPEASSLKG